MKGLLASMKTGSTAGHPWFAMEYVDGLPITEFADQKRLGTEARLRLFVEVCEAIQHAHHRGIIHRDLKPGNILAVEREGTRAIKIIDFGVSKAIGLEGLGAPNLTQIGQIIGTPEYMSPEQATKSGHFVDTRSDLYSLGVVLYELLVGVLPIGPQELRKAGYEGMRRLICEVETPRPSSRLDDRSATPRTAARARSTSLEALRRSPPRRARLDRSAGNGKGP